MAGPASEAGSGEPAEVLSGEIRIYDPDGVLLGGLSGYAVKRATREALLSAVEGVDELLYEIVWRDRLLPPGISSADFLPGPETVAASQKLLSEYLTAEGVAPRDRNGLLADLERWSRSGTQIRSYPTPLLTSKQYCTERHLYGSGVTAADNL